MMKAMMIAAPRRDKNSASGARTASAKRAAKPVGIACGAGFGSAVNKVASGPSKASPAMYRIAWCQPINFDQAITPAPEISKAPR